MFFSLSHFFQKKRGLKSRTQKTIDEFVVSLKLERFLEEILQSLSPM